MIPDLPRIDLHRAGDIVNAVLRRGAGWATPLEAAGLLDAIGIPTPRAIEALTEDHAVAAANAIGYPIALKAFGPTIVHKTERKALRLNLPDDGVKVILQKVRARLEAAQGKGRKAK